MINKKDLVVGKIYAYDMEDTTESKTLLVNVINLPSIGTKWLIRVFNVQTEEIFLTKENYLTEISVLIDTVYSEYKSKPTAEYRELRFLRSCQIMFAYYELINVNSIALKEFTDLSGDTKTHFYSLYEEFIAAKTEAAFDANQLKKCASNYSETDKQNRSLTKSVDDRFKKGDICVFDIFNETGTGIVLVNIQDVTLDIQDLKNPTEPTVPMLLVHALDDETCIFGVDIRYVITIPEFLEAYEFIYKLGYVKITSKIAAIKKAIDSLTPVKNTTFINDKVATKIHLQESSKKEHFNFSEDDKFSVGDYCIYDPYDTTNWMSLVRIESFISTAESFSKNQFVNVMNNVVLYDVEWGRTFEGNPALLTTVSTARNIYENYMKLFDNKKLMKRIEPLFGIVDRMVKEYIPKTKNIPENNQHISDIFKKTYTLRNKLIQEKILQSDTVRAECDKPKTAVELFNSVHGTISKLLAMSEKSQLSSDACKRLINALHGKQSSLVMAYIGLIINNNESSLKNDIPKDIKQACSCEECSIPIPISKQLAIEMIMRLLYGVDI